MMKYGGVAFVWADHFKYGTTSFSGIRASLEFGPSKSATRSGCSSQSTAIRSGWNLTPPRFKRTKSCGPIGSPAECPGQDLNLHASRRYHLKVVRLPIPPPGQRGMSICALRIILQRRGAAI